MIKIEETVTYGWEAAIRGMRNPKNSWDKSDSHYCWEPQYPGSGCFNCELNSDHNCRVDKYIIGKNDLELCVQSADSLFKYQQKEDERWRQSYSKYNVQNHGNRQQRRANQKNNKIIYPRKQG